MSAEDIAQDIELRQWQMNNLGRGDQQTRFKPDEPGYGPDECEECGAKMPAERRAWGFELCVDCKQATEPQRRLASALLLHRPQRRRCAPGCSGRRRSRYGEFVLQPLEQVRRPVRRPHRLRQRRN